MIKLLSKIRTPNRKTPFSKALFHTVMIICIGLVLGIVIKLLDIYTTNLGNIFSQLSVWIFLCVLLSIYSSTPKRAAANVFFFCVGMLTTYYFTAELIASTYSISFIYGWTIFAMFSPAMAACAWYAKGIGWISKAITVSIIIVLLFISVFLFDKIRIADIIFAVLTSTILLKKQLFFKL